MEKIHYALLFIGVVILLFVYWPTMIEPFASDPRKAYEDEPNYKKQNDFVLGKYSDSATSKRPVGDLLAKDVMPESQQCFVNFYALACRFTGFIGPMKDGYMAPEIAVQMAVNAGCRVFVLDIDYLDDCITSPTGAYFPQLVVRDSQGTNNPIKYTSNLPLCKDATNSNIKPVCDAINTYAFSSGCQQSNDPVVIVLNFLRQPPGSYNSKLVLDYFSNVAKALSVFQKRFLTNELHGGTFHRQKQEGRLLINNITDYNGKVLIFSNANTSGFVNAGYDELTEDLDFMTNLRLSYTQTKMGLTDNESGEIYGVLQAVEDFTTIPPDRITSVVDQTKLRWTVALSRDPSQPVSQKDYNKITELGVHCVPAMLFDPSANDYFFTDKLFKTYGFIPKPESLRYIKPSIVTPAKPNPSTDAKQGMLRQPTL